MRRTLLVLTVTLFAVFAVDATAAPGDEIYAKPGLRVSAGDGIQLNLYCQGGGSPTVVFEAGHLSWSSLWALVQPRVAKWTRACSFDRPGLGFSDPGPRPRSSEKIAEELHHALHAADVAGPYILVGFGSGGVNMRTFADIYLSEVAGLVLIETDARDVEPVELDSRWPSFFARQRARLVACRDVVATKSLAAFSSRHCDDELFTGDPALSPKLNDKLLDMARTKAQIFDDLIAELDAMPGDDAFLRAHRASLGGRPLRVITSVYPADDASTPADVYLRHLQLRYMLALSQSRLVGLSVNGKQSFVPTSGAMMLDHPDAVTSAIREVYEQSRTAAKLEGGR